MNQRLPVIVVSGFLGSGKTTFLRYLLRQTNKKFGLLINEFGEVGIDGDLIRNCQDCNDDSSTNIIELNNGCLCCTVQDDFIPAINSLLKNNLDIDAIIIETSGLALPIPLLKALNWPDIRASIYLDMVIGIVNGEAMLDGLPINNLSEIKNQYKGTKIIDHETPLQELFQEQLEVSDIVIISRSDLLKDEQFNLIEKKIREKIDFKVPIIKSFNGETNLGFIFDSDIQKFNHQRLIDDSHDHKHTEIFSDSIKCNYFLDKKYFDIEMRNILKECNFLRIKGRVWIPGKKFPLQVQIVGKKINTWYESASVNVWKPENQAGMELIIISLENNDFQFLKDKIKEKFNVSHDPKFIF